MPKRCVCVHASLYTFWERYCNFKQNKSSKKEDSIMSCISIAIKLYKSTFFIKNETYYRLYIYIYSVTLFSRTPNRCNLNVKHMDDSKARYSDLCLWTNLYICFKYGYHCKRGLPKANNYIDMCVYIYWCSYIQAIWYSFFNMIQCKHFRNWLRQRF